MASRTGVGSAKGGGAGRAPASTGAPGRRFSLALLGGFALRGPDGRTVDLPTRKCELLLAYLAMPAGQVHTRDKLSGLLWGEREDEQARGSLRKALSALRAALGADALQVDRELIALDAGAVAVDADRLATLAADPAHTFGPQSHAFNFGAFLDGKSLPNSELSDWLTFERTRCRTLAQTVLTGAAERLGAEGKRAEAMALAQRLLSLDTLREQSHRLVMRLHVEAGERSMALAQFNACRELLRKELGVEPSSETLKLAKEIATPGAAAAPHQPQRTGDEPPAALPTERAYNLSIAVLPFANNGSDAGQDHLAEGLSEDIITELSRQKDFLVIARQSSFQFASDRNTAAAAAGTLGVRYVLSGSLRRAGDQVRITVQLTDAAGDRCIWAERYDRKVGEIFDVQDEVVAQIIASIDAQVRLSERERVARKRPDSLDAWELFHRGMWHMYRLTRDDVAMAEESFRRAQALAPRFALPHAGMAYAAYVKATFHFVDDVKSVLADGIRHAEAALALDDADPFTHVVLGRICSLVGDVRRAERHLTIGTELSPSFAQGYFGLAQGHYWAGKPAEALRYVEQALRLNPKDPLAFLFRTLQSFCHFSLGDFAAAEREARRAAEMQAGGTWSRLALAVALEALGRHDGAVAAVAEARKIDPRITIASFDDVVGRVPKSLRDDIYAALRSAGLT